jgi:hypothetical protein
MAGESVRPRRARGGHGPAGRQATGFGTDIITGGHSRSYLSAAQRSRRLAGRSAHDSTVAAVKMASSTTSPRS